jgi:IS30 family transposase
MVTNYKQLSCQERDQIAILRARGRSLREIAKAIGRNPGTISRELRRNGAPIYQVYLPHKAQQRAAKRKSKSVRRERIRDKKVRHYILRKLRVRWSPELIARTVPKKYPGHSVSHEAIYQFIYESAIGKERNLKEFLVKAHRIRKRPGYRKGHTKSHIPNRNGIENRPAEAATRAQEGHWESDTIVSSKSTAAMAAMLERKSRYVRLGKLKSKTSHNFKSAINRRLSHYPEHMRRTMTYDNGTENAQHEAVNATLGTKSYFCAPYHSWEKGSVENVIGLVRIFFPKGTDFATVTQKQVKRVEYLLNTRPRKCLNYETPADIFKQGVALRG